MVMLVFLSVYISLILRCYFQVSIPVRCNVVGDVTLAVYHARQVLTKASPIKMFQLQFSTAFIHDHTLIYTRLFISSNILYIFLEILICYG